MSKLNAGMSDFSVLAFIMSKMSKSHVSLNSMYFMYFKCFKLDVSGTGGTTLFGAKILDVFVVWTFSPVDDALVDKFCRSIS